MCVCVLSYLGGHAGQQQVSSVQEGEFGVSSPGVGCISWVVTTWLPTVVEKWGCEIPWKWLAICGKIKPCLPLLMWSVNIFQKRISKRIHNFKLLCSKVKRYNLKKHGLIQQAGMAQTSVQSIRNSAAGHQGSPEPLTLQANVPWPSTSTI